VSINSEEVQDSTFRTHESYAAASFRAIGLQVLILIICYLPEIITAPIMGWLSLRLAYYGWKVRRAEKKKKQHQKQSGPWGGKK
jgi:uncharacterized membrane protein YfcA